MLQQFISHAAPTPQTSSGRTLPAMPEVETIVTTYGPLAVFLLMLLEDFGLPLPGEGALIAAAVLASQGHMSIGTLLAAAWAGAVLGDNIGYAIGRFGGRRVVLRYGARWGLNAERLGRVEHFFERFGYAVVIVARFIVVLRQLNGIVAGIGRMAAPRFLLYNALGAALWVLAWGLGVYWFGGYLEHWIDARSHIGIYVLLGVIVAGVGAFLWWRYRHRAR